jgi:ABC-type lipoprotein export system ATPase subunit
MLPLTATDLGKSYDGRPVLAGVSFTLAPGERALLLGPSGSGKSTLLNLLCGLQRADSGQVTLGEAPISDAVRRRHFGIVFQSLRLVSALSLRGNLALAQRLQTGRVDPARIDALLERLGIAHRAKARPHELSQGEAQRAAIARALVVRPAVLIADEPTSALDHLSAARVAGLLLDLAREHGAALLVATHDDRLRPHFARTLTLADGRLAA